MALKLPAVARIHFVLLLGFDRQSSGLIGSTIPHGLLIFGKIEKET